MSEPPAPDRPVADRLQALLNRTAEEDSDVVATRLEAVLEEVRALRAVVGSPEGRDRVADEVATLAAQVRSDGADAQEALAGLAGTVQTVAEETPAVRESVAALSDELGALRTRLDGVDALAERLAALQAHVDAVPGEIAGLRDEVRGTDVPAAVRERVDALQAHLDGAVAELRAATAGAATAGALEAVAVRLAAAEDTATRTAAAVVGLEDALTDRTAEVAQSVAAVQPVVERVDAAVADLPVRLDALRERDALPWLAAVLDEAAEARHTAAADVAALQERLTTAGLDELSGRLDALEARVGEVGTAVTGREDPDPAITADAVVERLRPLLAAEAEKAVAAQVPAMLEGVERRLVAHVDEAVLVLAEALLRRRIPATLAEPAEEGHPAPTVSPAAAPAQAPASDPAAGAAPAAVTSSPMADPAPPAATTGADRGPGEVADASSDSGRRRGRRTWRRTDG